VKAGSNSTNCTWSTMYCIFSREQFWKSL